MAKSAHLRSAHEITKSAHRELKSAHLSYKVPTSFRRYKCPLHIKAPLGHKSAHQASMSAFKVQRALLTLDGRF